MTRARGLPPVALGLVAPLFAAALAAQPASVDVELGFRFVEVGGNAGIRSYLVNDWNEVDPEWLNGVTNVAVTAGASAPEHLVEQLIASLRERGFHHLEELELVEEDVRFSLPSELAGAASHLTTISTR